MAIKLSVFDSPPTVKHILSLEKILEKQLKTIYSRKLDKTEFLKYSLVALSRQRSLNVIHTGNYYQKKKISSGILSKSKIFDYNGKKTIEINIKDSSDNIFKGAGFGLTLIQYMYNLDVGSMANGSINKVNAIEHYRMRKEKLSGFDFIFLALFAIQLSWYENAATYLRFATTTIHDHMWFDKGLLIINNLNDTIQNGLLLQERNQAFDFDSKFLPFSDSRFDHIELSNFRH